MSKERWTEAENALIRSRYPKIGAVGVSALLKKRTLYAIQNQARLLGVKSSLRAPAKYQYTEEVDQVIRKGYEEGVALKKLSRRLGIPPARISDRAQRLGIVHVRINKPWSDDEISLLGENSHKAVATICKILRRKGFTRSPCAIKKMLQRMEFDRIDIDRYSASALAYEMGVEPKTVTSWIHRGLLRAKKRDRDFEISRKDIRHFVFENAGLINLKKIVDSVWFIDLLEP